MPDEKTKTDKSEAPLLAEPPVITVAGREYPMRRLGVRDTFKLARILAAGAAGLGQQLERMEMTPENIGMLLIAGVPFAEKQAIEVLSSVIGVTPEEFSDPARFPMGSELEVIGGLIEHQDLKAFFRTFGRLIERAPGLASRSPTSSTASQDVTAGPTSKS